MNKMVEKKVFWIILGILFVLLIGALIYGLVMTLKYGEPDELTANTTKEDVKGVQPNNTFLVFCNDENLYALDANYASNPVIRMSVVKSDDTKVITDEAQIKAIWESLKNIKIADATSTEVTPAEYTLTFNRNTGSDAMITFQSPELLTYNGVNYKISDAGDFFNKL